MKWDVVEPGFPHNDLMKGSVFKTMKHLGVFPKEVPTGTSKLAYYIEAGFQKITPTNRKITEASK